MVYVAGMSLSLFLWLLLVLKQKKSPGDRILLIWMSLITVHQAVFYAENSQLSFDYPDLLGLGLPLPVMHGILLYFYVSAMTGGESITWRSGSLHFLPVALLIGLAVPFYTLSGEEKLLVYQHAGAGFEWYKVIQISLIVVLGSFYVIRSLQLIRRYRRSLEETHSNTDRKTLRWLEWLSAFMGAIWLLVLLFDDEIIFSGVVLMVLFIGFMGINQVPVFVPEPEADEPEPATGPVRVQELAMVATAPRYEKTGLSPASAELLLDRLDALMQEEAPFTDPDLSLQELAKLLDVPTRHLSQAINSLSGQTFYQYINTLRVEHYLRLVRDPRNKHLTLLALGFDAGFKSKSTFNKYVKMVTGRTPGEWV